jgi:hypothetical protein
MTAAPAALSRIDDGLATLDDRELADIFDRHSQPSAYRLELSLGVLPADVCPCGQPKEPAEPTCNSCFLDHEIAVDRSADV